MKGEGTAARTGKPPLSAPGEDSSAPAAGALSTQCQAITRKGTQCHNVAMPGTVLCFFHTPGAASAAGKMGGENRRRLPLVLRGAGTVHLESAEEVRLLLADTINRLRRGEIDTRTANAIGFLANIARPVIDAVEFERRLKALEGGQGEGKPGRKGSK